MISFVIPAHNEEAELPATLDSIHTAARALKLTYEVIVTDDSSTDRTGEVASAYGARVVRIEARHISAARNAGWRSARGDRFVFVDADTRISAESVAEAMGALQRGAIGGGAPIRFEGKVPFYAMAVLPFLLLFFRIARLTGGCFVYCRRDGLEKVGGWSERVYASEEIELARALKSEFGRKQFVIIKSRVATSGRKLRTFTPGELFGPLWRFLSRGKAIVESREHLGLWYGERRIDPERGLPADAGFRKKLH